MAFIYIMSLPEQVSLEFKQARCSPGNSSRQGTCYPDEVILEMRDIWNTRHPDSAITSVKPSDVWSDLRTKLGRSCNNERCWAVKLLTNRRQAQLVPRLFVPVAQTKWCRNPTEWLDSDDLTRVMAQYEDAHPSFMFLGPAPVDFATIAESGPQGWPELKNLNLQKELRRGKKTVGIIFNTDPHNEPGEHWISCFIDMRQPKTLSLSFSDSVGIGPPGLIKAFLDTTRTQMENMKGCPCKVDYSYNQHRHQKKNTECGVFCLHMIVSLLEKEISPQEYFKENKTDAMMNSLRARFFIKDC